MKFWAERSAYWIAAMLSHTRMTASKARAVPTRVFPLASPRTVVFGMFGKLGDFFWDVQTVVSTLQGSLIWLSWL